MLQSIGHWHQLVAQLCGPSLSGAYRPLLVLTFVVLRSGAHVPLRLAQHGVDEPGQLVGSGGDGLGRTQMGFLPPQEGTQGAVGAVQSVGPPDAMLPRHGWRWAWYGS